MKITKSVIIALVLMVVVAALYRVFPNRPYGFAPQYAMAIFGGAVFIKDKKWAFVLPILSMFLSDVLYQALYMNGLSTIQGFTRASCSITAYLPASLFIGFLIKRSTWFRCCWHRWHLLLFILFCQTLRCGQVPADWAGRKHGMVCSSPIVMRYPFTRTASMRLCFSQLFFSAVIILSITCSPRQQNKRVSFYNIIINAGSFFRHFI